MRIRSKLLMLALVPSLFMVLSLGIQVYVSHLVDREQHRGLLIGELARGLTNLDVLILEHSSHGRERAHVQWKEKCRELAVRLEELEKDLDSDIEQKRHLQRLRAGFQQMGQLEQQYDREFDRLPSSPGQRVEIIGLVLRIQSRLHQELRILIPEAEALYNLNNRHIEAIDDQRDRLTIALIVVLALFCPIAVYSIFKRTAAPLRSLQEGITRISQGDLDFRLTISSDDELGTLSAHFNEMSERRKLAEQTIRRMNEELERRVEERTAELIRTIGELRQSEERVRQNEERYRTVFENAGDGILILEMSGQILGANSIFCSRMGYHEDELVGRTPEMFDAPDHARLIPERMKRVAEAGQVRFESVHVSVAGERIPVEVSARKVPYGDGHAVISIVRDMSERKRYEQELHRSRQLLQLVMDHIPQRVFWKDTSLTYLGCNRNFARDCGLGDTDTIVGMSDYQLPWKEFAAKYQVDDREVLLTGIASEGYEESAVRSDGSTFWARTSKVPLRDQDGRIFGILGSYEDITDRKTVEKELRESRQLMMDVIDFLPDATFAVDSQKRVIVWNKAIEELSGVHKEYMVGKGNYAYTIPFYGERRPQLLDLLDRDDQELSERYHNFSRNKSVVSAEVFLPGAYGGRGAYAWVVGAPLYNADDERIGAIEVIRDITERKMTEAALKEAREAAEAASHAKSEFLANMSHEIRTPMNAISGMAYLALQTELDLRQRDYVSKIFQSAESLLGIINDVLDFSKIEAGKLELERIPFELGDVFDHVSVMMCGRAEAKGLEVLFAVDGDVPGSLVGDPLRLGQIIGNLLGNAIKFTSQGHVVISVKRGGEQHGDRLPLTFSVSDTGIGMTPDQLGRVVEPFTQADTSISRTYGGTGLGLSIVNKLLALMGGSLSLESEPGQGSRFSFTVPLEVADTEPIVCSLPPDEIRGMRVLLADDNAMAREVIGAMLKTFSFEVTAVDSGAAALDELHRSAASRETPYRLLFMDWHMPGTDGIETIRRIRDHADFVAPPAVIMVASYGRDEVGKQLTGLGQTWVLTKPVQASSLHNLVLEILRSGENEPAVLPGKLSRSSIRELDLLRGARVLVVEDNPISQQVAREILEQAGMSVTVADNGSIAIEALREGKHFDLVFMDIQMPVMDGYQATRLIREMKSRDELPVVAMTAYALPDERERCLESGMCDHVAKPVDPHTLHAALIRWIRPRDILEAPEDGHPTPGPEERQELPAHSPRLDSTGGIRRVGGNRELYLSLLDQFSEQYARSGRQIELLLARHEDDEVKSLLHGLKGVAGTIGAVQVQLICRNLEKAIAEEGRSEVDRLTAELGQAMEELEYDIRDLLEKHSSAQSASSILHCQDVASALLLQLRDLLRDNNLEALNCFSRLEEVIPSLPEMNRLRKHLDRLDFAPALEILDSLSLHLREEEQSSLK